MKIKQISLFLENRAGQLLEITKILAANGINMKALNIAETSDYGVLRLIVDDAEKTSTVLRESGMITITSTVSAVAVPDRMGGLNELLNVIADAEISIEYMYSAFGQKDGGAYMIFKVDDIDKFEETLAAKDVNVSGVEEFGLK